MRWPGFRKVRGQVRKRLSRRIRELGLEDLDQYQAYLHAHPEEWAALDDCCRITISRFFRDRAVFDALRNPILPDLGWAVRSRGGVAIRAWSAGCASGEEPYSLSLAWALDARRRAPDVEFEIVASDGDEQMLARARLGCYGPGTLKELPKGWVDTAFEPVRDEFCLRELFRRRVELVQQDIREEMPAGVFELVMCRNLVFTYFDSSLQTLLLERILQRLRPGGILVLGAHEQLPSGDWPVARSHGALPILRRSDRPADEEIASQCEPGAEATSARRGRAEVGLSAGPGKREPTDHVG